MISNTNLGVPYYGILGPKTPFQLLRSLFKHTDRSKNSNKGSLGFATMARQLFPSINKQ